MMEKETPYTAGNSSRDPTPVDLFSDETVDPVYQAKARILNKAIQDIGMGKYQVSYQINYSFFDGFELFPSGISLRSQVLDWLRKFFKRLCTIPH